MSKPSFAISILCAGVLGVLVGCALRSDGPNAASGTRASPRIFATSSTSENFDSTPVGDIPSTGGAKWRIDTTNMQGPAATWQVVADETAPTPSNVFTITSLNHNSPSCFNIAYFGADVPVFGEGCLTVEFKAISGRHDQGGGVMWRVRDRDNYYVCRANPLEHNIRVYRIINGRRTQIGSADVSIGANAWHTLSIEHKGDRIRCSLDRIDLLEVRDNSIGWSGGVGVWTKADAITRFDSLRVEQVP
jgi:hypothetical protein